MIRAMRSIGGLAVLVALVLPALGERCERPLSGLDGPAPGLYVREAFAPEDQVQVLEVRADGTWAMRDLRPVLAPPQAWWPWRRAGTEIVLDAPEDQTPARASWEPGRLHLNWLVRATFSFDIMHTESGEVLSEDGTPEEMTFTMGPEVWVWAAPAPPERAEPWTPEARLVASRVRTRLP